MALITQINYLHSRRSRTSGSTAMIQAVLGFWAVLVARCSRCSYARGSGRIGCRVLWSAADIVCLTIELKLLETTTRPARPASVMGVETTLLVGYPLLIAASGLWWRVHLVWITTADGHARLRWALRRRGLWR